MKNLRWSIIVTLFVCCLGCSKHITVKSGKSIPKPNDLHQFLVGVAQEDLTPPPCFPMAGYSINGRVSRGCWVSPKVTAFYTCDPEGTPFIFVATDLWAISEGQKLKVLEILHQCNETKFIGENDILLSATHTHHSLGVNFPNDAFAFSSIGLGFDKSAFEFTTKQIALAISKACHSASVGMVSFCTDTLHGIAKNRSIKAYLENNETERARYTGIDDSNIETTISFLKFNDANNNLLGILASYPMHPTATGDQTDVYSSDVFGLASKYISQSIKGNPIVAFYNGAEGDVAPEYSMHNRTDAVRIGKKLADRINGLYQSTAARNVAGNIFHRTKKMELPDKCTLYDTLDLDCYCTIKDSTVSTSSKASVGASMLSGASDGRTLLTAVGINEGIKTNVCDLTQGYKYPAGEYFVKEIIALTIFPPFKNLLSSLIKTKPPKSVPISIHQVGQVYFVGLPGEFTTMLGRRIKRHIAQQLKVDERMILLVGLADEYLSYITTPCEYNAQLYEGASNYYGIATGQLFVNEFDTLAMSPPDRREVLKARRERYKVGMSVSFGPKHNKKLPPYIASEGLNNLLYSDAGIKLHDRIIPAMQERSDPIEVESTEVPAFSFEASANEIQSQEKFYPVITIKNQDGVNVPVSDLIITLDSYADQHSKWTVRIPEISFTKGKPIQFYVEHDSSTISSRYFMIK
jgi:neutral ceramidase